MINFNKNSLWNLTPINLNSVSNEVISKVQFFGIQTPGFLELVPDSELMLHFANGFEATFEFRGGVDIGEIGRIISEFVL